MNLSELALPPDGTALQMAVLTTFDLDLSFLSALPLDPESARRFLVFYGDGRFHDCRENDARRNLPYDMLVPVVFSPGKNGWPRAHAHGKIWLFVFSSPSGQRQYRLSIHSRNLYHDDNLENQVVLTGRDTGIFQPKSKPLTDYLSVLRPFAAGAGRINEELLLNFDNLIKSLSLVRFDPLPAYACEDYELIGPGMNGAAFLQKDYDEMVIVCQRIQRDVLSLITKAGDGAKCTVVSNLSSVRELLLEGPVDVLLLPQGKNAPYIHAKIFLLRRGSQWDLYCGSMNLTSYAVGRNLEMMVHLKNPAFIHSADSFLSTLLGIPAGILRQRLSPGEPPELTGSPVFLSAASRSVRICVLSRILRREKLFPTDADRITAYILSPDCRTDLARLLLDDEEAPIPVRRIVRSENKEREVYLLPLRDRALLALVNQALHRYDACFSAHLFSHIRGKEPICTLSQIREDPEFEKLWLFRTDIHNFGASMDARLLSASIREIPGIDPGFCAFADRLLSDRRYIYDGRLHTDGPAVMQGYPLTGFFENVYLRELDARMESRAAFYARCADDILIGARTREELEALAEEAGRIISGRKLCLHEGKTKLLKPGDTFSWLGWQVCGGRIDFLPQELQNLRRFLRSETNHLITECRKQKIAPVFRRYMMISHAEELTRWLGLEEAFRVVSVPDGLREIDRMMCDMIRAVVSGKTGNAKYRIRYRDLQEWGFQSLVSRWYRYLKEKKTR